MELFIFEEELIAIIGHVHTNFDITLLGEMTHPDESSQHYNLLEDCVS